MMRPAVADCDAASPLCAVCADALREIREASSGVVGDALRQGISASKLARALGGLVVGLLKAEPSKRRSHHARRAIRATLDEAVGG